MFLILHEKDNSNLRITSFQSTGVSAVGCKIRLGLNCQEQEQKVYLRVVESANSSGLDYLTVHARHAKQRSLDLPTWSSIQGSKTPLNTLTPYPHMFLPF